MQAFADDLALVVENPNVTIKSWLEKIAEFGSVAGFTINKEKTQILSMNMSEAERLELTKETGLTVVKKVRYLGINLTSKNSQLFKNNYGGVWNNIKADMDGWAKLNLSLLGRIAAVKMMALPKMNFLFSSLPIIKQDSYFNSWSRDISKFIWSGKKPRVRMKILQNSKINGGLGIPNLKAYFEANCLAWLGTWCKLEDNRLLNLEGYDLRYGFHGYMGYNKIKVDANFKNHYVREVLIRVWNKYYKKFYSKTPMWLSPLEAHRIRQLDDSKWYSYKDLVYWNGMKYVLKTREQLTRENKEVNWFPFFQLSEKFKEDEKIGFDDSHSDLEKVLLGPDKKMTGKIYKLITHNEHKPIDYMKKWTRNIGMNINWETWKNIWKNNVNTSLCHKYKENWIKLLYRWYLAPAKLARIYKNTKTNCWNCGAKSGTFFHLWWLCEKAKNYWKMINKELEKIFKRNMEGKPESLLLGLMDPSLDANDRKIYLVLTTAAKIVYARYWKAVEEPSKVEWLQKIMETIQMEWLSEALKGADEETSIKTNWTIVQEYCSREHKVELKLNWN